MRDFAAGSIGALIVLVVTLIWPAEHTRKCVDCQVALKWSRPLVDPEITTVVSAASEEIIELTNEVERLMMKNFVLQGKIEEELAKAPVPAKRPAD